MHLKSLRMLLTVSDTGSFIATAEKLHTVQSNVTAHIKRLEAELGVNLLHRKKSHAVLTPAGRELKGYAEKMLQVHDEALNYFKQKDTLSGCLKIGSMETTMALRLPPILSRFHAVYPDVDIDLQTGPSAELRYNLDEGLIDCAFVAGEVASDDLIQTQCFSEQLVLVSSRPLESLPDQSTLASSTFVAFRQGCSYRHMIDVFLESQGIKSVRIFDFGSLDAILGCVAAGMGFALLPESTVRLYQQRYSIYSYPLADSIGVLNTYLLTPEPASCSPTLSSFLHVVTDAIASDDESQPRNIHDGCSV